MYSCVLKLLIILSFMAINKEKVTIFKCCFLQLMSSLLQEKVMLSSQVIR